MNDRHSLHPRSHFVLVGVTFVRRWAAVALVGMTVLSGAWWWSRSSSAVRETTSTPLSVDPTAIVATDYLGSQACTACHADRVAEFRQTNHFRACRVPEAKSMPPGFVAGRGMFASRVPGLSFEMRQVEGEFLQTAIHSTPTGEQRTNARIDLVYGAAPNDEVYFTWHEDRLYELPMAWLHPLNQWGASLFNPHGSGDFSRELTVRCLECHNTWFEHVPGTRNQYKRDDAILGVTCERCHGPGREHVTYHESHPLEQSGKFIVHPGHLTRERRMDLCAQCHSNAIKHRGPAFSYRPGQPLDASYKTTVSNHSEEDHVANQVQYLRQSKCFQQSDTLTCVTCHNPHRRKDESANEVTSAESSCLKCHQLVDCGERHRLPTDVQNKCVGCHMPTRNKVQVHFATEADSFVAPVRANEHRIAIDPVAKNEVLLAWHSSKSDDLNRQSAAQLSESLAKHWLDVAETCRHEYRFLAAIDAYRQSIRFDPAPQTREKLQRTVAIQSLINEQWFLASRQFSEQQYAEAVETLEAMLAQNPTLAKVHGKLGTLYATLGKRAAAVEHLQAVTKYDPDDPYGEGMLGWLAYLDGRFEEAIDHYRRADEIEPFVAKIHFQMGLAFRKLDQWNQASECFRQALKIDPTHAEACHSLSQTLRQQGQSAEALPFAMRAVQLSNQDPGILLALAEAFADVGRFQEAVETATAARKSAQKKNAQLIPDIQRRLEEFRNRATKAAK